MTKEIYMNVSPPIEAEASSCYGNSTVKRNYGDLRALIRRIFPYATVFSRDCLDKSPLVSSQLFTSIT